MPSDRATIAACAVAPPPDERDPRQRGGQLRHIGGPEVVGHQDQVAPGRRRRSSGPPRSAGPPGGPRLRTSSARAASVSSPSAAIVVGVAVRGADDRGGGAEPVADDRVRHGLRRAPGPAPSSHPVSTIAASSRSGARPPAPGARRPQPTARRARRSRSASRRRARRAGRRCDLLGAPPRGAERHPGRRGRSAQLPLGHQPARETLVLSAARMIAADVAPGSW